MPNPVTDPDLLAQLNAPDRPAVASSRRVWGDQEAEAAGLYEPQQSGQPKPVTDPVILSQLNGNITIRPTSFQDRYAPAEMTIPDDRLSSGLGQRAQAMTRGPEAGIGARLATDFTNVLPAAMQGTAPHVDQYQGRLVSADVFQNDAGDIMYRDASTGQVVPTDSARHVALRDPADGRLKIFDRSDATNEGGAVGMARVLAQGLVAGAPTARASIGLPGIADQTPRASDIFATATPHYREFRKIAGKIEVPEETALGISERIRRALGQANLIPELAPPVYASLNILEKGGVKTIDELQNLKRVVGRSFKSPDKNVRDAAAVASREIFKVISEVSKPAGEALGKADAIHSTAQSLRELQNASAIAGLRTGRAGYGGNAVNNMRQVLSPIVQNAIKGRVTGFRADEIAAMRDIVEGTTASNLARGIGQFSPTRGSMASLGGMATGGGAGLAAAGPVGLAAAAALPILGAAGNKVATVMTRAQIERLNQLVAKRSPAYAQAVERAVARYERAAAEFGSQPTPSKFTAFLNASRSLSSGFQRDGISIASGDLLRAIQGPMKSAADGENPGPEGVIDR